VCGYTNLDAQTGSFRIAASKSFSCGTLNCKDKGNSQQENEIPNLTSGGSLCIFQCCQKDRTSHHAWTGPGFEYHVVAQGFRCRVSGFRCPPFAFQATEESRFQVFRRRRTAGRQSGQFARKNKLEKIDT